MSAVWVVRDADGGPLGVGMWRGSAIDDADFGGDDLVMEELSGGSDGPFNGFTVTRETLLTPAQAAVIAAAKAYADEPRISTKHALMRAVTTLRAQEGE